MDDDLVKIYINTDVEAHPVLVIQEDIGPPATPGRSNVEVPRVLLDQLTAAQREVYSAEEDIMRYVAERYDRSDVREWVADQEL